MNEHSSSKHSDHSDPQKKSSIHSHEDFFDRHTYQRIQNEIRTGELWDTDHTALIQQMKQEGKRNSVSIFSSFEFLFGTPMRYAYSAAAACMAAFILLFAWNWLPAPATQIQFISQNKEDVRVPFLWRNQLQMGFSTTVPNDVHAVIQLNEGSEIQCAPGTQLSLHVERDRIIQMDAGRILVSAAHIDESQMKVQTPLFDVIVVGTKFEVELISKQ